MRLLSVVHQADAGPGVFARVAVERDCELVEWNPPTSAPPEDAVEGFDGVLVLGGSANPSEDAAYPWLSPVRDLLGALVEHGVPTLGICLGAELLAEAAGGASVRRDEPQIGWFEIDLTAEAADDPVLRTLPRRFLSFQWHTYGCAPPPGATVLAGDRDAVDGFRMGAAWGLQFHPEVTGEIVADWLADYRSDSSAVAAGFDPAPVAAETADRIESAERIGATIFGAFLDYAHRGTEEAG